MRRRKDGELIEVSLTVSPVRNEAGEILGASKIARDITAQKRNEEELARHRHHLESLVEARTRELAQAKDAAESARIAEEVFGQ